MCFLCRIGNFGESESESETCTSAAKLKLDGHFFLILFLTA